MNIVEQCGKSLVRFLSSEFAFLELVNQWFKKLILLPRSSHFVKNSLFAE